MENEIIERIIKKINKDECKMRKYIRHEMNYMNMWKVKYDNIVTYESRYMLLNDILKNKVVQIYSKKFINEERFPNIIIYPIDELVTILEYDRILNIVTTLDGERYIEMRIYNDTDMKKFKYLYEIVLENI